MEALRNWALTVALAALAGGIVRLLTPKGSVEKALRTVVAVFLLSAFLSPMFSRGGVNLDWILPAALDQAPTLHAFELEIARQIQQAVELELRTRIERALAAQGLDGQILVRTDILSDGGIEIVTAKVILPRGSDASGLVAALKAEIELDVEIVKE